VDNVFESFRKIGLEVEQRREPLEVLVDSMERTPADNLGGRQSGHSGATP